MSDDGRLRETQASFDVRWYDIDLQIDPACHRIEGRVIVRALAQRPLAQLDLDLDSRLTVKAVTCERAGADAIPLQFLHEGGRLLIQLQETVDTGAMVSVAVYYEGQPKVSSNPPFDGGFVWAHTKAGADWVGVCVQSGGAQLWWPCKAHPSDKPEDGMSLSFTAPGALVVVSNGRLDSVDLLADGQRRWRWTVSYPINSYNVTLYAAPYVELSAEYFGLDGQQIPFSFFVLPEDSHDAGRVLPELVKHLSFLEETFGPYPFRGDKFAVVMSPYIGMEHQSAIAYGRAFDARIMGFLWIALHEAAHEWWGNMVAAENWRDFWLHEGFAKYTEALYAGHLHGQNAYHEYLARFVRPQIKNDMSLAPRESHSIESIAFDKIDPTRARRDPYAKGAMVLHTLRYLLGEDAFFELLRRHAYPDAGERDGRRVRLESSDGFARRAKDVCGVDLTWFFEVYLRQKELPRLCIDRSLTELRLWWEAPSGLPFPMPVELEINGSRQRVSMPEFGETVIATNGRNAVVDPDWWILRDDAPDPDCFGTLGLQAVSLDDAIKSGR